MLMTFLKLAHAPMLLFFATLTDYICGVRHGLDGYFLDSNPLFMSKFISDIILSLSSPFMT